MNETKRNRLIELRKILRNNQEHVPEYELETRFKRPYEKLLAEIEELERELGEQQERCSP